MHRNRVLVAHLVLFGSFALGVAPANGAPEEDAASRKNSEGEVAIRKASEAYVAAMNRDDTKTLLSLWTENGQFIDAAGTVFRTHDLLNQKAAPGTRAADRSQLKTEIISLRFVTPDVAVEDGASQWTGTPRGHAAQGRYTAVWVRREGRWLLDSVRETAASPGTSADSLKELEWMLGEWAGQSDESIVLVFSRWSERKHFILRSFQVLKDGKVEISGTQRIGWDPVAKRIKSWSFDNDGSYGDGPWTRDGDKWIMKTTRVLPDGTTSLTTFAQTRTGEDSFTLERLDGGPKKAGKTIRFERKTGARTPE